MTSLTTKLKSTISNHIANPPKRDFTQMAHFSDGCHFPDNVSSMCAITINCCTHPETRTLAINDRSLAPCISFSYFHLCFFKPQMWGFREAKNKNYKSKIDNRQLSKIIKVIDSGNRRYKSKEYQ